MKVLLYFPGVDLNRSVASSNHLRGVMNNLNAAKNKYHVVVNISDKYVLPNSFNLIRINLNASLPLSTAISEIYGFLVLLFEKLKIDIIYQRETILGTGLLLKFLMGSMLITEVNGIIIDEIDSNFYNKKYILFKLISFLNKIQIKNSDVIVAVSNGVKQKLVENYDIDPRNIIVVENGVDINLFKPADINQCKKDLGLDPNWEYICYVGSLERWQRVNKLLDVMEILKYRRNNVKLLIVGDGPEMNTLQNMSKVKNILDCVSFVGRVDHTEIPKYINSSIICVAPFSSARNASPLKLLEYMACGKAIVGHCIGLKNANNIILKANATQPNAFVDKIEYLIDNHNMRCELGQKGLNYVVNNCSWSMVAQKIENVFDEVYNLKNKK
jgi:glycosyltransferase involved in cell wall biosynthesis